MMKKTVMLFFAWMIMTGILISGCAKEKKTGKVEITGHELVIKQDSTNSFAVNAKGKLKNVGSTDLKNIVVTGYCRSCQEIFVTGKWFISDVDKTPDQKAVINYLTPGSEESFEFKGIAFYFAPSGSKPDKLPEKIDLVIESFEVAN